MSSSPPNRSSRRLLRSATLLLLLLGPALLAAPGGAAEPVVDAVLLGPADGQIRMVLRLPDGAGGPETTPSVSVDGVPQRAAVDPLLSDRLAVALVVDASADGAEALPSALAGAANLALAVPASARRAVVADTSPPAVVVPWPSGAAGVAGGLGEVRSGGARDTAAALDAAVAQLPADAVDPRLVVLFTSAPDAGGDPARAVAERLRSAGVVLAVLTTLDGPRVPPFWGEVAAATGGLAVVAPPAQGLAPTERVVSALARTRLLTMPAPPDLPATVVVRTGSSTTEVVLPAAAAPSPSAGPRLGVLLGLAGVVALVLVEIVLRRRRRTRAGAGPAPSRRQVWSVPPLPDGLLDRDPLSAELAAALRDGRPVWLRPDGGAPGLGTTTALLAFAHRHRDRYDVVWWIPALDPDLVPERLAELAVALGAATDDDPVDAASAALGEALPLRGRRLLLLDDAAGPGDLVRHLPPGPADVLVASDDTRWGEVAVTVTVPAFRRDESVALLRAAREDVPRATADGIAVVLDDLPLAVVAAAGLLVEADADTVRSRLTEATAGLAGPDLSAAALGIALDRLADDDPLALALLTAAAWAGPTPVPLSLVTGSRDVLPPPLRSAAPQALHDRADLLGRRGLARATAEDLLVHPVTARLLRGRTGHDHASSGGWAATAVRMVRSTVPEGSAAEAAGDPSWRWLLPHVLAVTDPARPLDPVADEVSGLLARAGEHLTARGRPDAGRVLLEDAHRLACAPPSSGDGRPAGP